MSNPPRFPIGPPPEDIGVLTAEARAALIARLDDTVHRLLVVTTDLDDEAMGTRYRNWTVSQIVQHVTDSHVNAYVRLKWALTEENPVIKAYSEDAWSARPEAQSGDIDASLALLDGIHACWALTLHAMTEAEFERTFQHPETGRTPTLADMLAYYAWHGHHHAAQIAWMRTTHGWD